jgi:hypothetical protein
LAVDAVSRELFSAKNSLLSGKNTGNLRFRTRRSDFLLRTIGVMSARDFYTRLEALLSSDYHYWLQRGSLEVEVGDVRKAENFLGADME